MAEDRGGLDYKIDVVGEFDDTLKGFVKRVRALSDEVDRLNGKLGKPPGGTKPVKPPKDPRVPEGKQLTAVEKKLLALKKQMAVLQNKDVQDLQAKKNLIAQIAKLEQERLNNAKLASRQAKDQTKAAQIQTKLGDKARAQLAQLRTLRKQGVTDETKLAQAAGITVKRVRELMTHYQRAADQRERLLSAEKQAEQIAKTRTADVASGKQAIKAEEAQAIASQKNLKASNALAIKKAQVLKYQKDMNVSQRKAAELAGVTSAQAKQLGLKMWDAEHAARQFLFTFRRLVGILAIFTAARKFAQAIGAAVTEISRFNSEIETAELGIASIVASVGKVYDGTGKMVTGADAFAASLEASRAILAELKRDAIGSIATFEALVKSYQVAIGPGLAAGLDLDQIKDVSKRLAEGAITLGVPLNQLSEEIRSLLQGTATARNTRIAVLFGGAKEANEAIRNAKEQGNLYEVLIDKLQGIAQGAEAATQSFNVLKSDLTDAVQLLLAEGGIEYFNQLKNSLIGLQKALTQTDASGDIGFTPEALGVVQEMAGAMAEVIASFREVTDTGQALVFLRNALATIGDVLKALAPLASGVFQGLITGVNLALAPLRLLADILRAFARVTGLQKLNKGFAKLVKYLVAGVVALRIWHKLIVGKALVNAAKFLGLQFKKIIGYLISINVLQKQALTTTALLPVATNKWAASLGLVNLAGKGTLIWIALAAIAIGYLVVHFKLLEKITGVFNKQLTDSEKAAARLEHVITSAGDATAEGAKSAKEWRTEFQKLERELVHAKGIQGLTDGALDIGKLFQDMVSDLTAGTYQWELQKVAAQDVLDATKKELAVLKERKKFLEKSTELKPSSVTTFGSTGGLRFQPKQEIAQEGGDVAERELRAKIALKEADEASFEIIQNDLRVLELKTKILEKQKSILVRTAEDGVRIAEQEEGMVDTLFDRANVSIKELATLKAKNAVRDAEIGLVQQLRKEELETAEANRDDLKALRFGQIKFYDRQIGDLKRLRTEQEFSLRKDTKGYKERKQALDITNGKLERAVALYEESTEAALALARAEEEVERVRDRNNALLEDEQKIRAKMAGDLERQKKVLGENISLGFKDVLKGDIPKIAEALKQGAISFNATMQKGIDAYIEQLPALGDQMAEIITGSLSDISGVVAGVFKDAIDPRTDADLATAFGEFFLDLAGQMVEAITSQLIADALSFLPGIGDAKKEVADQRLITALDRNSMAQETANTKAGTPGAPGAETPAPAIEVDAGGGGAGDGAASQAASKAGGFLGGLGSVAPWLMAIFIPIIIALLTSAFKKGGKVQAFASGGDVNKMPRPSNIPASDTVPAWLTPGEFVMRKEAVDKYGMGIMDAINRGILRPSSFGSTVAPVMQKRQRGVRAFAAGGAVAGSRAGREAGSSKQTVVLPILATSENNMEQMISGGRTAFVSNLNKSPLVGDPNRSGSW